MIERMTDAQFATYRKILKENCPDFAHGCDGVPLCAEQKKKTALHSLQGRHLHTATDFRISTGHRECGVCTENRKANT